MPSLRRRRRRRHFLHAARPFFYACAAAERTGCQPRQQKVRLLGEKERQRRYPGISIQKVKQILLQ